MATGYSDPEDGGHEQDHRDARAEGTQDARHQKGLPESSVAIGPRASAGMKLRAATSRITKISVTTNVGVVVRSVPALNGATGSPDEGAREGEHGEHRDEAAAAPWRRRRGSPTAPSPRSRRTRCRCC